MAPTFDKDYVLKTVEERDVHFVRFWFTDVLGMLKSFAVTDTELEGAFEEGMGFDGSSIDGFTRLEESDMIAYPEPRDVPAPPVASHRAGRRPHVLRHRQAGRLAVRGRSPLRARRMTDKAADLGFTMYVGPELEFFYFADDQDTEVLDNGGYFDLTPLDIASDLRRETVLTLEKMGIPVEYSHHEVAPSQHEIDLRYADALTMADNVMTYRLVVKEIALQNGVYATFMPKPIFGQNGSGMHVHQSLFSKDGNAFFDANDPEGFNLSADRQALHRRSAEVRTRVHRRHQPARQLLQASGSRLRGSRLHRVGPPQPLGARPRPDVQARQGERHSPRAAFAGPLGQPVPRLRRACSAPASRVSRRSCRCMPEATNNIFHMSDDELEAAGINILPGTPRRGHRPLRGLRAHEGSPRRAHPLVLRRKQARRVGRVPHAGH